MLYLLSDTKKVKIPSYAWILLIYFFYTLIWSFLTGEADERGYRIIVKNPHLHTFFAIVLINNFNFTDLYGIKAERYMKITVIAATVVSVIQVFNSSFMDATPLWMAEGHFTQDISGITHGDIYSDRRPSIFEFIDLNELGLSYLPLLSVLIGLLLYKKYRYSYFIFLILGGATALLSNTRYIIIAFILLSMQITLNQRKLLAGKIKYIIIFLILGIISFQFLNLFGYSFGDWVYIRLFPEGAIEESSRYKAFYNFAIFFPQKAWFGFGEMTNEIRYSSAMVGSSQIHVGYLAHLVVFGIIGSFLLFGFWFMLAKHLYKNAKLTGYWGSFFAFLIFLWANATLVYYHIFFYGIIIALVIDKYLTDKINSKKVTDFVS